MRFPLGQTLKVARYIARRKRAGDGKFPLVLMLEPLHVCNLTCAGCGRIREYKDYLSETVPLEDCIRAIDDCGTPVVSICGGEPLLYPQIKGLVEEALARGRVVYLCTNGLLLGKKISLFRPHKFFNINVHLDGLARTHDEIAGREGVFDKAVEGIRLARAAGFTVCTNTTVYAQTNEQEVCTLIRFLKGIDVNGILLSPGFDYSDAPDHSVFLTRGSIVRKFGRIRSAAKARRIWSTPLFLDFLAGMRDYACTPWGNVTYNVRGWKAPCYLITDGHYPTFGAFMKGVDWARYGPSRDSRCANCMAHCGFETTVALSVGNSLKDSLRMALWTIF